MLPVVNISSYKFAHLSDLKSLRESLTLHCKSWGLKGTILLSTEGINLFVAGVRENIDSLVLELKKIAGLEELSPKYSESEHQPFTRMLVKIKKEIIAFGVEGIDPSIRTSPKLKAKELKKWLDEGRDLILLDTRNDYEVKLGTFDKALPIGVKHFRDFPSAVDKLPKEMKDKPVVMFCTGGIRCEKAGPYMEKVGFKNVFQLDGGILKYFEECGKEHYNGTCFVFDQRVAVDPTLHESVEKQCYICLSPLTLQDQENIKYIAGKSCPFCYRAPEEKMADLINKRHEAIKKFTNPLPGCKPYANYRPAKVPAAYAGYPILDFYTAIFPHLTRQYCIGEFKNHHILNADKIPVTETKIIKAGERYLHLVPHTVEPDVNAAIEILHEDQAIIVINKPAPLPVHPCGRYNRNTLQTILNEVYFSALPRPAHRLDANTTGVMVLSKSKHFAKELQYQFLQKTVQKAYRVKVHGHPESDSFSCDFPIAMNPGDLGSRIDEEEGLPALTHFKVLQHFKNGTSLLEAVPITGRTNQIRVHLWKLGHPVFGDPTYLLNQKLGDKQTLDVTEPPLCLHSYRVSFIHPIKKERVEFICEPPNYLLV